MNISVFYGYLIAAFGWLSLFVSSPLCEQPKKNPEDFSIRGVYVGVSEITPSLIRLVKKANINAFVIDIRNDSGDITCNMDNPNLPRSKKLIKNIKSVLKKLKDEGFYTIARIVTFRELERNHDSFSIRNKDGSIYVDKEGKSWINPYDKRVQEYIIEIAESAAKLGFDEIQFDYLRFPPFKSLWKTSIAEEMKRKPKVQVISEFVSLAVERLHKLGVKVSADVFGCVIPECMNNVAISVKNLGQDYKILTSKVDFICPMIYPSHWPVDSFGIPSPDLKPYEVIKECMECSREALGTIDSKKVRPWIQAFSATWLKKGTWQFYKKAQIDKQISALKELKVRGYCLWNPSASYTNIFK